MQKRRLQSGGWAVSLPFFPRYLTMLFKKTTKLIKKLLSEGLSPKRIAIAIALGIMIGIIPIYGVSTAMCGLVIWGFKLNAPVLFANHYAMTFVTPFLIIPFLRIGEWIFRAEPMPLSVTQLTEKFSEDAWGFFQEFGWSFLHASVGWVVSLPIVVGRIYVVSLLVIERWPRKVISDQ